MRNGNIQRIIMNPKEVTIRKCQKIEISYSSIIVEKSTPAIPPILQMPWNLPTIFFSNFSCRESDCVLIATLMIRSDNANKKSETINPTSEKPQPSEKRAIRKSTLPNCKGILLLYFATIQPDRGIPIMALAGIIINKLPNSPSVRLKIDLIVGILEANVEKQIPDKKK